MRFQDAYEQTPDTLKIGLDMTSIGLVVGTLADHLPAVAAVLSIIWSAIRIYETKSFGRLIGRSDATPRNSD